MTFIVTLTIRGTETVSKLLQLGEWQPLVVH